MTGTDAIPRLSATVLLLRDDEAGIEVFMVERHHRIDFAAGAIVFPGGSVDAADGDPALRKRAEGEDRFDDRELAFRMAAVREAFEESGLLLCRPAGQDAMLAGDRYRDIEARYRVRIESREVTLGELVEQENLTVACDALVAFAHWITPTFFPKRFETFFFLALAPGDQIAVHDGSETVDSFWISPAQALADREAGKHTIVFATRLNLEKLSRSDSVAEALAAARSTPIVTVLPEKIAGADGDLVRIPENAGYLPWQVPLQDVLGDFRKKGRP